MGFVLPPRPESGELRAIEVRVHAGDEYDVQNGPCWFPSLDDMEGETWTRMWTRRVLDEEELLASTVTQHMKDEFEGQAPRSRLKVASST